jgi:hypothetical protein
MKVIKLQVFLFFSMIFIQIRYIVIATIGDADRPSLTDSESECKYHVPNGVEGESIAQSDLCTYRTKHRYSDFLHLHEMLRDQFPSLSLDLPEFPKKKYWGNMDPEFVRTRMHGLRMYLQVLCDAVLSRAKATDMLTKDADGAYAGTPSFDSDCAGKKASNAYDKQQVCSRQEGMRVEQERLSELLVDFLDGSYDA